jgi:hypothetical protein
MGMVEIESHALDQSVEYLVEENFGNKNLARTLKQDSISRILLAMIRGCGFGLVLIIILALAAALTRVLGINMPGLITAGEFLGRTSLGLVLSMILLIVAFTAYIFLRRRTLNNPMLYAEAGCPQCWENELVRVRRHKPDRLISRMGIPVHRYTCRNCDWQGLRVGGQSPHFEMKTEVDLFWDEDEIFSVRQDETAVNENM